jgi:hypothetical protein
VYIILKGGNKFNTPENKVRGRILDPKKNVRIVGRCNSMPFISHCYEEMVIVGLFSGGQMPLSVTIMINGEFGRMWR